MPEQTKLKNPLCYCGERFNDFQRENIHKSVCRNNPVKFKDERGHFYCVFHYPNISKVDEFALAYDEKVQNEDYLFYGTWFPFEIDFLNHSFNKYADFIWTTFNFGVSFENAKFLDNCDFSCSKFQKRVSFKEAEFSKIENDTLPTRFHSVTFESVADFEKALFKNETDFSDSKFWIGYFFDKDTEFLKFAINSSFSRAIFSEKVSFEKVRFGKEIETNDSFLFSGTVFEKLANFQKAEFWLSTSFGGANFKKTADFRETFVKNSLSFEETSFEHFAKFSGKENKYSSWGKGSLNFSRVEVEKPDRISFQTLQLKPDAFTDTDVRKFDFTDIEWKPKNFRWDWSRFKDFLSKSEEARSRKSNYKRLEKVYRRFASYAEENNDYDGASKFRFTAFDIQRVNNWHGRQPFNLLWWYKLSSNYGESWLKALIFLILILSVFTVYYHFSYFSICPKNSADLSQCITRTMTWGEAIHQSLMTALLQNVEYRKSNLFWQDLIVILEKILAPIQAALLVLAIRRKFMR